MRYWWRKMSNIITTKLPKNWVHCDLGDLGFGKNAIVDGPFGSNLKTSDYIDNVNNNGVPVLTTKNLYGDYSDKSVRYILKEKYNELKRSEVKPGDILVAKIGSVGKTGIYPQDRPIAIIPANLLKFTVNPIVVFNYVYNYLNYEGFLKLIKSITTATAQPAFNVTKFRMLPIPIAPLPEQRSIVAKIEKLFSELDNGIANLKATKDKLKIYRQAVLKKAFNGELTKEWREKQENLPKADDILKQIKEEHQKYYESQLNSWNKAVEKWEKNKPSEKKPNKPDKLKNKLIINRHESQSLINLPEGWAWVNLDYISTKLGDGLHGTPKYSNGEYYFINGSNLNNGKILLKHGTKKVSKEEALKHYRPLSNRTVLVSINGTLGNVAFYNSEKVILGKSAC